MALCLRLPMILSVVVYFAVFVVGHLMDGLVRLAGQAGVVPGMLAKATACILPNLETFNVAHEVGLGQTIVVGDIAWSLLYAVTYCSAMMVLAVLLFRRREVF